jgi:hypothetical protein
MSYLLFSGPSVLDGQPIFAALTGIENPSRNSKTGPLATTWVMRSDIRPWEAIQSGEDKSVCGDCSLRGKEGTERACYVLAWQAPARIYDSKHKLKPLPKYLYKNRVVRLGGYGEHSAMPTAVTADISKRAAATLGYTHQWRTCDQELSKYLMASCDSEADRELAKAMGWATFRVKTADQPMLKGETTCPASAEAGKKLTCFTCGKCAGGNSKDVVINIHGHGRKHFKLHDDIKFAEAAMAKAIRDVAFQKELSERNQPILEA